LSTAFAQADFGYRDCALQYGIALVGFTVWGHHMFTSLTPELRIPFMITSMISPCQRASKIFKLARHDLGRQDSLPAVHAVRLGSCRVRHRGISGVMLAAIPSTYT